jgi:hypothetical protein
MRKQIHVMAIHTLGRHWRLALPGIFFLTSRQESASLSPSFKILIKPKGKKKYGF